MLEPIQETGAMPEKLYTAPAFREGIDDENWSIITVSKISVFQICFLRMVITFHSAVC